MLLRCCQREVEDEDLSDRTVASDIMRYSMLRLRQISLQPSRKTLNHGA